MLKGENEWFVVIGNNYHKKFTVDVSLSPTLKNSLDEIPQHKRSTNSLGQVNAVIGPTKYLEVSRMK